MPLLPLRSLPVNDAHDGPLTMRVDVRSSGSVYVYVRRESDKKTWCVPTPLRVPSLGLTLARY
jgi:hypothetical protein